MTIYDITEGLEELEKVFSELEENEEITEEQEEKYAQIKNILLKELETKQSNIIALIKNKTALVEAIGEEEKRLKENKEKTKKQIEKIKELLMYAMESRGDKKLETELGNITIANKPPRVEIINEDKIPQEFIKIQETRKVDKTAIKNLIKETGELVDGVKFITGEKSIRIK